MSLRGAPYRNGGINPATGFDCSGFVRYVYEQHGVRMPREVREQFRVGKTVDRNRLEPGDLVFFSEDHSGVPTHVGIANGDGTLTHASNFTGEVSVTDMDHLEGYMGARRLI